MGIRKATKKILFKYLTRPDKQHINRYLFDWIVKYRGFNNLGEPEVSGEQWFIEEILSKSNVQLCLAIGANKGDYSRLLLEKLDAKVIACEPLPIHSDDLQKLKMKYGDRFEALSLAVGEEVCVRDIYYDPNMTGHSSLHREVEAIEYVHFPSKVSVQVTTIDQLVADQKISHIDLIKIDTEGYELHVLAGAENTLKTMPPEYIQFEFNWHYLITGGSLYQFHKALLDYDLYRLLPKRNGWIKVDPVDWRENIFAFSNYVAVHKG
jgi:FkbM family methyltransferase